METTGGRHDPQLKPVIERMFEAPHRLEFAQAMRLLERAGLLARRRSPGAQGGQAVGLDHAPAFEAARFGAAASLAFPSSEIAELRPGAVDDDGNAAPPTLIVSFIGLTGPMGALPRHYTSLIIERAREKDASLRDFLDLFNHRAVSLFHRSWEKYRLAPSYERWRLAESSADDPVTSALHALMGSLTGGLRGRMGFADEHLLRYAGHFAHHPRNAVSLEMVVQDYFGAPTHVEQFIGQWLWLSTGDRSCLPSAENRKGLNCQLGVSAVVGEKVWDVQAAFRVTLGPLTYADYVRFLPESPALCALMDLVRLYAGAEFDFDVQPVLKADEVPECRLGSAMGQKLGRNLWLKSRPFAKDFEGARFARTAI